MKRHYLIFLITSLATFVIVSREFGWAQSDKADAPKKPSHVMMTPEVMKWEPLSEGAEVVVLAGDPFNQKKVGVPFVFRVKHKDGFELKPHWHPMDERITVITGTMLLGTGDEFKTDPAHVTELPAGSYAFMPKIMRHYFITRGETIAQFEGIGPFRMTFVKETDDPQPPSERH